MEKIEGYVQITYKKEKLTVRYVVDKGLINLDRSDDFDSVVYKRAYDRVSKIHQEEIDEMLLEVT